MEMPTDEAIKTILTDLLSIANADYIRAMSPRQFEEDFGRAIECLGYFVDEVVDHLTLYIHEHLDELYQIAIREKGH